jgi:hypothetical protein
MKKQIVKKIISVVIISAIAMFFLQMIPIVPVSAATKGLDWENPNKNGQNPYKFKLKNAVSAEMLTQVVGCTGVVDKVSSALSGLGKSITSGAGKDAIQKGKDSILKAKIASQIKQCKASKDTATAGGQIIQNVDVTEAVIDIINCKEITNVKDAEALKETQKVLAEAKAQRMTTECLNGIAIQLARNQLTAMTRYTMNWVNSGFSGDPMYVRNITSFTGNLERNVLETGVNKLLNPNNAYPYGRGFSQSLIRGYNANNVINNFANDLSSDLSRFLTDPRLYYSKEFLDGQTPLQKSILANQRFSDDFSVGGWDAYNALLDNRNNILGSNIIMSEQLAAQTNEKIQNTKDELSTNNGFFSQKKCVLWQVYDANGLPKTEETEEGDANYNAGLDFVDVVSKTKPVNDGGFSKCIKEETVTPGSIIQGKVDLYVNSPERQLEIADTINSSLNALFSALLTKFQDQGLSSLSSESYVYSQPSMGVGSVSNNLGDLLIEDPTSGGYRNTSFDLTRNLGNTFVYDYSKTQFPSRWDKKTGEPIFEGWDAKNNSPRLTIGLGPFNEQTKSYPSNVYYIVTKAGNTKLFNDAYQDWAVGDRAFWNGEEWQNWKKGVANPIAERGVIQIQKDYVVAARSILSALPGIMPKVGELDYCIPGPNPNWQTNSGDVSATFNEYASSLSSDYKDGSFLKRDSTTYKIAKRGQSEFDNYGKVFATFVPNSTSTIWESPLWKQIWQTLPWRSLNAMNNLGKIKNDTKGGIADLYVSDLLTTIVKDLSKFNEEYAKKISGEQKISFIDGYGKKSLMQTPLLETENTSAIKENPAWLPMAETGLSITENIVGYDEDIQTITQDYKDSIIAANTNVYKLNLIKEQVNEIVRTAQGRRNEKLLAMLNKDTANDTTYNVAWGIKALTLAQFKEKYKTCLAEENVIYFDNSDITKDTGDESLRCGDGLDNDLDGLVDVKDPDCFTQTNACNDGIDNDNDGSKDKDDIDCQNGGTLENNSQNISKEKCEIDTNTYETEFPEGDFTLQGQKNTLCEDRKDAGFCLNGPDYYGLSGMTGGDPYYYFSKYNRVKCKWSPQ